MDSEPNLLTFVNRRLLRLMYVEQLSRAKLSPFVPPADTTEIPLVVLVGYEAAGKGRLARRLSSECKNVEKGILHTTADYHSMNHYHVVTRRQFDDLILNGSFLTYTEMFGQSYGLSREQAAINGGKVKIVCLTLTSALMLRLRGLRPILILTTCQDKAAQKLRQNERKECRFQISMKKTNLSDRTEKSTLQCMISGTILVTGIINEIINLATADDGFEDSKFVVESECSLFMDSQIRPLANYYERAAMLNTLLKTRSSSIHANKEGPKREGDSYQEIVIDDDRLKENPSIASLYTNTVGDDPNLSDLQIRRSNDKPKKLSKPTAFGTSSQNSRLSNTKEQSRDQSTDISKC